MVLLSFEDDEVVHVASLLILTLERARTRLSIRGNLAGYGHRDLAALFLYRLRRVGINPLDRHQVSPWNSAHWIILSIEFCVELDVQRLPVRGLSLRIDPIVVLVSCDWLHQLLLRPPRAILLLLGVQLPAS